MLVRKSVRQCEIELSKPESARPALYEDQDRHDNVIELNRYKENDRQPATLTSNDILLQASFSRDTLELVRNPFIQKYRQMQEIGVYPKNKNSLEISI